MRDTSRIAAESVIDTAPQLRARIFDEIRQRGGMTCDEVEHTLKLKHQTASARVNELMEEGKIVDSGQRRLTSSERPAIVWVEAPPKVEPEASLIVTPRTPLTIEQVKAAGGYKLIYADPAWVYKQGGRGAARNHYKTVKDDRLASLPVSQIAAEDAVCFMWGTWPTLKTNIAVLEAWEFEYKTLGFLWVKHYGKSGKPFWGGGFWSRSNSEFCLLGVRGDIRRISAKVHQLIETWDEMDDRVLRAPIDEHSAKPAEVRNRIVELMGDLPAIELFARNRAPGWDAWGNQVPGGSDVQMVLDAGQSDTVTVTSSNASSEYLTDEANESENASAIETQNQVQEQGEEEMANLPLDMATEIGKSTPTGTGNFIRHGDYLLLIKKWFFQKTQDRCVITEFLVIDAKQKVVYEGAKEKREDPNAPGSDCSEVINFDGPGKLSAPSNQKALVLGLFGLTNDKMTDQQAAQVAAELCKMEEDGTPFLQNKPIQPAKGMLIKLSTAPKQKREKKDEYITARNWECVDRPGSGLNAPHLVAERLAALTLSPEECVKVSMQQYVQVKGALPAASLPAAPATAPAVPAAAAPVTPQAAAAVVPQAAPVPVIPQAAPAIPVVPAVPTAPADPFAGWTPHPQNPAFYYRGSEIKSADDIRAGR